MDGPAALTPPVSCATETISKFLSFNSLYNFCHPGRSKRQPHHEAQVSSKTFLPRKFEERVQLAIHIGQLEVGRLERGDITVLSSARGRRTTQPALHHKGRGLAH
jgi:hypothetical protein